ncbi:hypothetical protein DFH09DRAFT_1398713 [Mycena vulgaris]|nr:hypothetical protein DFH09DRAFT_1398713 [Mycena vulgaris]
MSNSSSALTLPPDLERSIFELAALRTHRVTIPKLMRVAWRVKHWLEPLLYHTLVFGTADPIDDQLVELDTLPVCHLYCSDENCAWARQEHNWEDYEGLATLPHFTHLASNSYATIPFATRLLDERRALYAYRAEMATLSINLRFVMMAEVLMAEDGKRGILTGSDFWMCADDFIRNGGRARFPVVSRSSVDIFTSRQLVSVSLSEVAFRPTSLLRTLSSADHGYITRLRPDGETAQTAQGQDSSTPPPPGSFMPPFVA